MELPVLVGPLPVDLVRRGAEVDAEHPVDHAQDVRLLGPGRVGAAGAGLAHRLGSLPQQPAQRRVHPAGVGRALGLGHERLGHQAVLADDGHEHVPLAAVLGRRVEQERDGPVVDVAVSRLDDRFEEVVGPLDLVPEHGVVLRELEVLEPHLLHGADAQQVEPGEQPAPAAALLVGDLPVVQQRGEGVLGGVDDLPVDRHVIDGHPGHRVLREPVGGASGKVLAEQSPGPGRSASRPCSASASPSCAGLCFLANVSAGRCNTQGPAAGLALVRRHRHEVHLLGHQLAPGPEGGGELS